MSVLRCLTLNLWGAEPPLEARMNLIAEGIRDLAPDVVALQEVCAFPDLPNQAETLARATGLSCLFAPAIAFRGGHEGLAILSRPPVLAHETRELPHCQRPGTPDPAVGRADGGGSHGLGARHPPELPPDPRPAARGPGAGHRRPGGQPQGERAPDPDGRLQRPARVGRDALAVRPDHPARAADDVPGRLGQASSRGRRAGPGPRPTPTPRH